MTRDDMAPPPHPPPEVVDAVDLEDAMPTAAIDVDELDRLTVALDAPRSPRERDEPYEACDERIPQPINQCDERIPQPSNPQPWEVGRQDGEEGCGRAPCPVGVPLAYAGVSAR